MSEFKFGGEIPETTYSAAEKKIKRCNEIIAKADNALELLRIDAEALETFIEESIEFVEIANNLGAEHLVKENRDQAMVDIDALIEVRKKIALIKDERARLEASIARFEEADAELTKLAGRTDTSGPLN